MTTLTPRRHAVLAALVVLLAFGAGAAPAAAQAPPSVRLVAADGDITLYRFGRSVQLDLGVWVAASGGEFRLDVVRPNYETPAAAEQVDAQTGDVLRTIPAELLDGWSGLERFIRVTFRNSEGRVVAWRYFTFCPNGFERQRLDDSGPVLSRYPELCAMFSPFARGTVWGIDEGWASAAVGSNEVDSASIRLPEGRYSVDVRIPPRFRERLQLPLEEARVTLNATVKQARFEGERARVGHGATGRPAAAAAVPTVTDPDPSTLPDLAALPAWSLQAFHRGRSDFLAFAASPWNAGPAAMVVEGFRRPGEDVMDAYQYFRDADGNVVGRAPVGTMKYDPRRGHEHWHFLQFAVFTLHDASSQEVVRSRKQAFCLVPTDAIDLTVPGAAWTPWSQGVHTVCGSEKAVWVREDLDAGWADTYYQSVPGQSFNITTLPNGWYEVRVHLNPLGNLYEVTNANNVETRLVYLGGRPGTRRLTVLPWHGIKW